MTDQLISYKTAKLAKEKKFDIPCQFFFIKRYNNTKGWYVDNEYQKIESDDFIDFEDNINDYNNTDKKYVICSAPTQSLLQRWLREKHEIHVNPICICNFFNKQPLMGYVYSLERFVNRVHDGISYDRDQIHALGDEPVFNTYEEALEEGLFQSLNLVQ